MLAKGYTKAELPRLARAARFYAEVNHCAEFEALDELTTPGSKANRLMQYGGRFLESAANFANGLYQAPVLYTTGHVLTHDLKLSEDGRTATITQTITADLSGLGADMNDPKSFGQVTISQRLVIDLEPDIPVVTDYKLSQTIE